MEEMGLMVTTRTNDSVTDRVLLRAAFHELPRAT